MTGESCTEWFYSAFVWNGGGDLSKNSDPHLEIFMGMGFEIFC